MFHHAIPWYLGARVSRYRTVPTKEKYGTYLVQSRMRVLPQRCLLYRTYRYVPTYRTYFRFEGRGPGVLQEEPTHTGQEEGLGGGASGPATSLPGDN